MINIMTTFRNQANSNAVQGWKASKEEHRNQGAEEAYKNEVKKA